MRAIAREKKVEVASLYVLGLPYGDIVARTGVSKGSVVGIIKEAHDGRLAIPGTPPDQLVDLRRLGCDLQRTSLDPSQAALGLVFLERLQSLGAGPEDIDKWASLVKEFHSTDTTPKRFLEAAIRLRDLEEREGKPFEEIAIEYEGLSEERRRLHEEVGLLEARSKDLSRDVDRLSSEVEGLKREKKALQDEEKTLRSHVAHYGEMRREMDKLVGEKIRLEAEVGGKGEEVKRLKGIGFEEQHLSRLRSVLEKVGKEQKLDKEGTRQRLFDALDLFRDISQIEDRRKALKKQVSTLRGEISVLEERKAALEGAVQEAVSSGSWVITEAAEQVGSQMIDAGLRLRKEVDSTSKELETLYSDLLKTGIAVGQMLEMVNKGENSHQALQRIVEDVKKRLGES